MAQDVGSGAASGAAAGTMVMPGWGTLIGAGIGALGAGLSMGQAAKQRKRLAQLRAAMLNQVDTGASNARGRVAYAAKQAQGGATQDSINRGFYNSSVATDAAGGITMGAARDMGDIDAKAGSDRAQVMADTFDQGGGPDLSGLGRIGGMILASRLQSGSGSGSALNGSPIIQKFYQTSPMLQAGGSPTTNDGTYEGAYSGGGGEIEDTGNPLIDQQIASAQRRRKWAFA